MNSDAKEAIRHEIDALKRAGGRRRELSLHACQRLFVDHAIRPTVATVRELTGVGSAGDIPKDIDAFWEQLRQTAASRAAVGAIPPELEHSAGALLGELYRKAIDAATEQLDIERRGLAESRAAAADAVRRAELERDLAVDAAREARASMTTAEAEKRALEIRLEFEHQAAATRRNDSQSLQSLLDRDNEALRHEVARLRADAQAAQTDLAAVRAKLQQNAEAYADQIKDAIANAERRVKPLLLELDTLRGMASTYESGSRDLAKREYDFIQQLSVAKGRIDTLESLSNRQADEIASLHRELALADRQNGVPPAAGALLATLANTGRLEPDEVQALGTAFDGFAPIVQACPACGDGEPELSNDDGVFELRCPDCDHASGPAPSRIAATAQFARVAKPRVQKPWS
ncbi:DNA-binding protein [Pararobbsia silviterrae]|uniref:DNA-binding protein n=1 Tax=Pararobbsia silviterrae TaxID=1792498 RepID=A0A494XGT4_9BURK|nr:DNA-binding protein [Pararobbsia silviterrae]RKP49748.1 DNA-binding protein [Pararobbsia silviterrae]